MAGAALTPEVALERLADLSADVRASVLCHSDGSVSARAGDDPERAECLGELARELFDAAEAIAPDHSAQIEVTVPEGGVFAVRSGDWTIAVVAGRLALSSLLFYDLRSVMRGLPAAS